jgi:hypothetical protein
MSNTYRSKPSLDECLARIIRAEEHIERLEDKLSTVGSTTFRWTANDPKGRLVIPDIDVPPIVRILIGETLYNLRTALDYLVSQLFYLATGKFDSRTKFLIEDSVAGWDRHFPHGTKSRAWLHLLAGKHQTALQGLQPFNGCKWTKTLQTLSNIDKHRHFVAARGSMIIRAPAAYRPGSQTTPAAAALAMEMKRNRTRSILFDDGTSVIETLIELQKRVADVIQAFEPDFK